VVFGLKNQMRSKGRNAPDVFQQLEKRSAYEIAKRTFDITAALGGIILVSPLMFFIALLIKCTSPGPIFYRGVRTGRFGISFHIIKFRSMIVNADQGSGTTSRNDPRVTSFGNVLRRYKLDELPQLFNVLVGNMSFVGPRPELFQYTCQYKGEEKLILAVRPGITDYSSIQFSDLNEMINDEDPDTSFETKVLPEKNRLRLQYAKECNFWLDIRLILQTLLRIARIK
jgi:lipopolysaccharide/colanic/teichoic acid biosynthesis glycosyltransferase